MDNTYTIKGEKDICSLTWELRRQISKYKGVCVNIFYAAAWEEYPDTPEPELGSHNSGMEEEEHW